MSESRRGVIVVGAGLAGAVVARELSHRGHDVLIVEGRDRTGGRAWTQHVWGREVDVGGQALHWMQPHVWSEITRYGLEIYDWPAVSDVHLLSGSRVLKRTPEQIDAVTGPALTRLYAKAAELFERPFEPLRSRELEEADQISVGEALQELRLPPEANDAVHALLSVNFNARCDDGALSQVMRRFSAALNRTELLPEVVRWRVKGGFQQLVDLILEDASAELRLSTTVTAISSSERGATLTTADGSTISADFAVVTAPIEALSGIEFSPALGGGLGRMAREGQVTKGVMCWAYLKGPYEPFIALAPGANPLVFMRYDGDLEHGVAAQVFGPDADRVDPRDPGSVQRAVRQWFPDAVVEDVAGHDWISDPFSRETWAMLRPGQLTADFADLGTGEDRLLIAGSDYANGWAGYFDGAIESAIDASRRIRARTNGAAGG